MRLENIFDFAVCFAILIRILLTNQEELHKDFQFFDWSSRPKYTDTHTDAKFVQSSKMSSGKLAGNSNWKKIHFINNFHY